MNILEIGLKNLMSGW